MTSPRRRSGGHLLYADDIDDTAWREHCSGYCVNAFAAPIHLSPGEPPAR